jgi:hypothetical protein
MALAGADTIKSAEPIAATLEISFMIYLLKSK